MLVLGLVLVVIAAVALVAAFAGGSNDPATFDLGIFDVETNTLGVFLLGAATVLLLVIGLGLIRSGVRRSNRRRKDKKQLSLRADKLETLEADRGREMKEDPDRQTRAPDSRREQPAAPE